MATRPYRDELKEARDRYIKREIQRVKSTRNIGFPNPIAPKHDGDTDKIPIDLPLWNSIMESVIDLIVQIDAGRVDP